MNWDAIVWILLLIFGVASIGGGLFLYLQSSLPSLAELPYLEQTPLDARLY